MTRERSILLLKKYMNACYNIARIFIKPRITEFKQIEFE